MNIPFIVEPLSGYNIARKSDYVFGEVIGSSGNPEFIVKNEVPDLPDNSVVFCKTDYVYNFFEAIKGRKLKVNLITHESDYPIDREKFSLTTPNIRMWYGININYSHPQLRSIPIGLGNSYCQITPKIDDIRGEHKKEKLLFINHRIETNRSVREWIYKYFKNSNWCTVKPAVERCSLKQFDEYKKDLSSHKFILCPQGNGIDTHRMWEALYCNTIPVVEKCINFSFYSDLPILVVGSFKELNEDNLNKTYEDFKNRQWNWGMLTPDWWIKHIKE